MVFYIVVQINIPETTVGVQDCYICNTSNEILDFQSGGYSVTISIHGTAIQHGGSSMPCKATLNSSYSSSAL
jgi:hypothetical protein